VGRQKVHSFANFGLWVSPWDLQMCAMCVGFPNCPEGQKRAGKNYFFLAPTFNQRANIFYPFFQILLSGFNVQFQSSTCS
jgi:hypothetical protein